jgi:hypothetical protein
MDPKTASGIMANEMLREKLRELEGRPAEFNAAIDQEIGLENRALGVERDTAERRVNELEELLRVARERLARAQVSSEDMSIERSKEGGQHSADRADSIGEVAPVTHIYNIHGPVGQLNVGDQQTVENIQSNLHAVGSQGGAEIAEALKALSEAAVRDQELDQATRTLVLDAIEEVSDGAKVPVGERRLPKIMRAISYVATTAGAAGAIGKAWSQYGAVVTEFFKHM